MAFIGRNAHDVPPPSRMSWKKGETKPQRGFHDDDVEDHGLPLGGRLVVRSLLRWVSGAKGTELNADPSPLWTRR